MRSKKGLINHIHKIHAERPGQWYLKHFCYYFNGRRVYLKIKWYFIYIENDSGEIIKKRIRYFLNIKKEDLEKELYKLFDLL